MSVHSKYTIHVTVVGNDMLVLVIEVVGLVVVVGRGGGGVSSHHFGQ